MKDKRKLFIVLLIESVLLFCTSGAYFFWFSKTSILLSIFAVLFPLIVSANMNKLDYSKLPYVILFILFFIFHSIVTGGSAIYSIVISIIPLFLFVSASLKSSIIDFYVLKAFPIVLAISVGFYILEGLSITHLPVFPVEPLNDAKQYYYISHIFFLQDSNALTDFARFNSYYEECGVIGSMVALFLFSHGEKLPVWVKIVYILSGLMTFSMFFYIMFAFYAITSFRVSKRSWLWILVIGLAVGYFILNNYDSDFIDTYFHNRFAIENGEWVGHDRESNHFMDFFWNDFIYSNDLWLGTTRVKSGGWSIFRCITENGIIVVAVTVLLYIGLILRNKKNKHRWIYVIAFLAMFYQRPEFWSFFYFVFFTSISDLNMNEANLLSLSDKSKLLKTEKY